MEGGMKIWSFFFTNISLYFENGRRYDHLQRRTNRNSCALCWMVPTAHFRIRAAHFV